MSDIQCRFIPLLLLHSRHLSNDSVRQCEECASKGNGKVVEAAASLVAVVYVGEERSSKGREGNTICAEIQIEMRVLKLVLDHKVKNGTFHDGSREGIELQSNAPFSTKRVRAQG